MVERTMEKPGGPKGWPGLLCMTGWKQNTEDLPAGFALTLGKKRRTTQ